VRPQAELAAHGFEEGRPLGVVGVLHGQCQGNMSLDVDGGVGVMYRRRGVEDEAACACAEGVGGGSHRWRRGGAHGRRGRDPHGRARGREGGGGSPVAHGRHGGGENGGGRPVPEGPR
jgi:hypothetical protein